MENEQCSWYQFQKTNSNLDKFIKECFPRLQTEKLNLQN